MNDIRSTRAGAADRLGADRPARVDADRPARDDRAWSGASTRDAGPGRTDGNRAGSDPYAVLGVPRDASKEDISAAYQRARSKYDPDQVTHLSAEVQEHFKTKAQEVARAHQKLSE